MINYETNQYKIKQKSADGEDKASRGKM